MGQYALKTKILHPPMMAFALICALFVFTVGSVRANTLIDPDFPMDPFQKWAMNEKDLAEKDFIYFYKQLQDIDSQGRALKTQEDWINLKVDRLKAQEIDAPYELTEAIRLIHINMDKNDIESAKANNLMKDSANRVLEIYEKVLERFNGKCPDWWVFDPELARYLKIDTSSAMKETDTHDYIIEKSKESVFPEEGEPYTVTEESAPEIRELNDKLIKGGIKDWLEFQKTSAGIQLVNVRPILFETGKSFVAREYVDFLSRLSVILKPYELIAYIKGYADSRPIRTSLYPSNWELAAHRASNVAHIMIDKGMAPSKFRVISRGEYGVPRPNDTKENMQENRNVKMIIRFKSLPASVK